MSAEQLDFLTVDDAERLLLQAAAGELDVPGVADWLCTHSTPAS